MNPKRDLVDRVFHASRGFGHNPGLGLTFPLLWGAQWKAYKYTPPHQLVEIELVHSKINWKTPISNLKPFGCWKIQNKLSGWLKILLKFGFGLMVLLCDADIQTCIFATTTTSVEEILIINQNVSYSR
jgi:hypothetical protein